MTTNNESGSSLQTYKELTNNLGKEFVDRSLLDIIGFDETLDIAQSGKRSDYKSEKVSTEIASILSDVDSAIKFARTKILNINSNRFKKYFGRSLNKTSTIEDVKVLMSEMIDEMNISIDNKSIEEAYFDFMFLFTFNSNLKFEYSQIFGQPEHFMGITILPQEKIETHIKDTDFRDKFLTFLNKFYNKIDYSNEQDKLKVYFISEFLRIQSGEREGIGNSMNPMIQFMKIDDLFGNGYARDVNGLFNKLVFKGKQNIPGTTENIRKKIGKTLEKIISNYMFPLKYYKY